MGCCIGLLFVWWCGWFGFVVEIVVGFGCEVGKDGIGGYVLC